MLWKTSPKGGELKVAGRWILVSGIKGYKMTYLN